MQWGRQTCSNGHDTEYKGHVQASLSTQRKSEFLCVDYVRNQHSTSTKSIDEDGRLYPAIMRAGASDEVQYSHNSRVGCSVCSVPLSRGSVYPRWGHTKCPSSARTLYSGFVAASAAIHTGGGYNALCMHPSPQPAAAISWDIPGGSAFLYGVEYKVGGQGAGRNEDAACVMCEAAGVAATYVQWGR